MWSGHSLTNVLLSLAVVLQYLANALLSIKYVLIQFAAFCVIIIYFNCNNV